MLPRLILWSALAKTALSACSAPGPLSLPVTDVRLPNGNFMRGVQAMIGSPAQNFSFMPIMYLNDTWVYNTSAPWCDTSTPLQCNTQHGGEYNSSSSSTFRAAADVYVAGGDPSDTARSIGHDQWYSAWTTEDLTVSNVTLSYFPIGMAGTNISGWYDTQNNIGLGVNSTLLSALVAAGHISSRSYSWWWGQNGASSSAMMDGSLVLGGYDAAKVLEPNLTMTLSPPSQKCQSGMSVLLSSLGVKFPNDTTASIIGSNEIAACLLPDFPVIMTLDSDYYESFEAITGTQDVGRSLGINYFSMLYEEQQAFQGDLIMTISEGSGLSVTIPNDLLFVPDQTVSASGGIVNNATVDDLLINSIQGVNANDTQYLGRQFFSAVYLMVDLDAGTFTLWNANATTEENLVAIGGNCSAPKVNTDNNNSTATSPSHSAAATSTSRSSSLSTGALVGAVVGSAFGAGILVSIAVICFLRRRRGSVSKQSSSIGLTEQYDKAPQDTKGYPNEYYGFHEMEPSNVLQEMAGSQTERQELSSTTKPTELPHDREQKQHDPPSPVELG